MIKKLRIKFISILMASLVLILGAIMLSVNLINYNEVSSSADQIIDVIVQNNGKLPKPNSESEEGYKNSLTGYKDPMNPETPFDTRFFTCVIKDDNVVSADVSFIASVNNSQASDMALKAYKSGKNKGYDDFYRFRVTENSDSSYLVVFLDYYRQLEPTRTFFITSMWISLIGCAIAFVVVFFISKLIIKPVAEGISKQKRFITDAAHELKTPLTIISANNELIKMESGENEMTGVIDKEVIRMNDMVKNMTSLSKLDESSRNSFEVFDLTEACRDVSSSFATAFKSEKKKYEVNIEKGLTLKGSQTQIRKLGELLIDNALKYSLTFTSFSLTKSGSHILIEVKNDAEGIKEGDMNRVFERFYRSAEARGSKVQGSGIGLSIAHEIVTLHKGKISAQGISPNIFSISVFF